MVNYTQYLKGFAAVVATILTYVLALTSGNHHLNQTEWINVIIVGFGALGVFISTNFPAGVWKYCKQILAAATAGATVLASVIIGGVTYTEWIQIIVACGMAVGVIAIPNINKPAAVVS